MTFDGFNWNLTPNVCLDVLLELDINWPFLRIKSAVSPEVNMGQFLLIKLSEIAF